MRGRRRRASAGRVAPCLVAVLLFWSTQPAAGSGWGLAVQAGAFDIAREDFDVLELGAELRFPSRAFALVPVVGVMGTEQDAIYVWAGLRRDLSLGRRWVVTPNAGVGIYDANGGKDLGGPVEFRTGLELAYRVTPRGRLGLTFYHISNARFYDDNPGSNSLALVYGFDLDR